MGGETNVIAFEVNYTLTMDVVRLFSYLYCLKIFYIKIFSKNLLSGSDKNQIKETIDRHHFFSEAFEVMLLIICKLYPR